MGKADYLLSAVQFKSHFFGLKSKLRGMFLDRFQMKHINNAVIIKPSKFMVFDSCCVSVVSDTWNKFELADSVPFVNRLQTWLQGFAATVESII